NYDLCFADQKASSVPNSCANVSSAENTQTQNLLNDAIASTSTINGEHNIEAVFNMIEEVGRRGCNDSIDGLLIIAQNVEATRSLNNGRVSFEVLGTRKLQAVINALEATSKPEDTQAMAFLNRIANESYPIIDGRNGYSLQN